MGSRRHETQQQKEFYLLLEQQGCNGQSHSYSKSKSKTMVHCAIMRQTLTPPLQQHQHPQCLPVTHESPPLPPPHPNPKTRRIPPHCRSPLQEGAGPMQCQLCHAKEKRNNSPQTV